MILGTAIGAVSGGVLMKIGRRRSMFICLAIGLAGNSLTIDIDSFWLIMVGRLLFGASAGLYSSIVPKMMAETIPQHLLSSAVGSFVTAQTFSQLIIFLLGEILPDDKDTEALRETNLWLVFYIYIPVGMQVVFLASLFLVVRYEPIKFLIQEDRTEEAILAIRQMYKYANDDEMAHKFIDRIRASSGKKSSDLTLRDALVNPQYCRATWVNVGHMIVHELTGINVIVLYSNTIFKDMDENGRAIFTPRQGVYLVGLVAFLSSFLSTQVVRLFGRRTLLLAGQLGMTLVHSGVAVFNIYGIDIGVITMVMVFMLIFQNSSGPIAWIYCSETTIDAGMGICLLSLWGTVFILSLVCPIIMDPSSLGPTPTFFIFGGMQFIGFFYVLIVMKETAGLTDREKKLLFTPKRFLEGKE